jgi:MFS family permease
VPDRVVGAQGGSWTELFTHPQYRGRTWLLIVVWLLAYAGLVYGVGAFAAVYMVDHGGSSHFVFLTIAVAYAALFVGFLVNARLGEQVERQEVIFVMGLLFAASWAVAWLVPNLWIIALCYIASRIGTGLFLFNLYNYTAVAYPTRIRQGLRLDRWAGAPGRLGGSDAARAALSLQLHIAPIPLSRATFCRCLQDIPLNVPS